MCTTFSTKVKNLVTATINSIINGVTSLDEWMSSNFWPDCLSKGKSSTPLYFRVLLFLMLGFATGGVIASIFICWDSPVSRRWLWALITVWVLWVFPVHLQCLCVSRYHLQPSYPPIYPPSWIWRIISSIIHIYMLIPCIYREYFKQEFSGMFVPLMWYIHLPLALTVATLGLITIGGLLFLILETLLSIMDPPAAREAEKTKTFIFNVKLEQNKQQRTKAVTTKDSEGGVNDSPDNHEGSGPSSVKVEP